MLKDMCNDLPELGLECWVGLYEGDHTQNPWMYWQYPPYYYTNYTNHIEKQIYTLFIKRILETMPLQSITI